MLAYALVCLAAPVFLARIGELTVRSALLAALPFAGLIAVLAFYLGSTASANAAGLWWAGAILCAVVAAGALRLARNPGLVHRVGVHDWPVDADCIDPAEGR